LDAPGSAPITDDDRRADVLERIDSPANVLAFRAVGEIDERDYENTLKPAVEAMTEDRGELRFVYVPGDEFARSSRSRSDARQRPVTTRATQRVH
jgi:hypothetical protein